MAEKLASPKESAARKAIDGDLVHLGWVIDESKPDCNVFTERAKTEEQVRRLDKKRPDYILYEPGTNRPIAVIEAKRPGGTLDDAVEQGRSRYAQPLGVDIVFGTDGVLCQSYDLRSNAPLLLDGEPVVDLLAPKLLVQFADQGPSLITPTKVRQTKQELMSIFAQANDLLRKEGLREGIERFSEFSNLLFLKLISEIEEDRESRGEPRRLEKHHCWEAFASRPPDELLDYVNDTVLPRLARSYNMDGDVFQRRLAIANPETLKAVVRMLSKLSLLDAESDVKGDAFEYFLKHSVTVGKRPWRVLHPSAHSEADRRSGGSGVHGDSVRPVLRDRRFPHRSVQAHFPQGQVNGRDEARTGKRDHFRSRTHGDSEDRQDEHDPCG